MEVDTPLQDAIDKLGTSGEGFELDAARTDAGAVSIEAAGTKYLGKGWSLSGGVAYAQHAWAAVGKLMWKPKA